MRVLVFALLMSACGSTGDSGGGAANLPVSGAGPFAPLTPSEPVDWSPPVILSDVRADVDEPVAVTDGTAIALWVTAKRNGTTQIDHADLYDFKQGFGELQPSIVADQAWEAGAIRGPAIVWDQRWILFYAGGGGLGWATADDGHTWVKAPGPALLADTQEEGSQLGPPAIVRDGDRLRVYYPANGAVWAADAPFDDVLAGRATTWTRLDGDPRTPERDPMVRSVPFLASIDRVTARAAKTPAGRVRHDLYLAGPTPPSTPATSTCAFASTFTGTNFAVAGLPILPPTVTARACAETPYGALALLFYIQRSGARDAVGIARSP